MKQLEGKRILITGGTGSLGTALVERLLKLGVCESITVFSRGEDNQHEMRQRFPAKSLHFVIGDVRDYRAVSSVVSKADIIFHTAALKHVPTCEVNPIEAVKTNIGGVDNIIRTIKEMRSPVETVIGVSTDKGCQPVNVYGATKFIQERLLVQANHECSSTRFVSVLYGNVMSSRGSVIPLFKRQIREGGPVTITDPRMTRFLISLDLAVDTLLSALATALPGEVYVPKDLSATTVGDIAMVLIDDNNIAVKNTGIRFGEKMHEILISNDEVGRTFVRDGYFVVSPVVQKKLVLKSEYISNEHLISKGELRRMFKRVGVL